MDRSRDITVGLSGRRYAISFRVAVMKSRLSLRIGFRQRRPCDGAWPIQVMRWYPGSMLMIPKVSDGSQSFFLWVDVAS